MLKEIYRSKLDSIVAQMESEGQPESEIQFVVDDFKSIYDKPEPPELPGQQPQGDEPFTYKPQPGDFKLPSSMAPILPEPIREEGPIVELERPTQIGSRTITPPPAQIKPPRDVSKPTIIPGGEVPGIIAPTERRVLDRGQQLAFEPTTITPSPEQGEMGPVQKFVEVQKGVIGGVQEQAGKRLAQTSDLGAADQIERGRQIAQTIGITTDEIKKHAYGTALTGSFIKKYRNKLKSDQDVQDLSSYGISVLESAKKEAGETMQDIGAEKVEKSLKAYPAWIREAELTDKVIELEKLDPSFGRAFKRGDLGVVIDQGIANAALSNNQEYIDRMKQVRRDFESVYSEQDSEEEKAGKLKYYGAKTFEILGPMLKSMALEAPGALIPGGQTKAVAGVARAAARAIGSAASLGFWMKQGTGDMYNTLTNEGVPHDLAIAASVGGALPYAYIEKAQIKQFASPGVRKIVNDGFAKYMAKKAAGKTIDLAKESIEEAVQSFVTDGTAINTFKQAGMDDKAAEYAANQWKKGIDAAIQGGISFAPLNLIGLGRAAFRYKKAAPEGGRGQQITAPPPGPKTLKDFGLTKPEDYHALAPEKQNEIFGQLTEEEQDKVLGVVPEEQFAEKPAVPETKKEDLPVQQWTTIAQKEIEDLTEDEAKALLRRQKMGLPAIEPSAVTPDEAAETADRAKFMLRQAEKAKPKEPSIYDQQQPAEDDIKLGQTIAKKYGLNFMGAEPGSRDAGPTLSFEDPISKKTITVASNEGEQAAAKIADATRQENPEVYGKAIGAAAGVEYLGRAERIVSARGTGGRAYNTRMVAKYKTPAGTTIELPFTANAEEVAAEAIRRDTKAKTEAEEEVRANEAKQVQGQAEAPLKQQEEMVPEVEGPALPSKKPTLASDHMLHMFVKYGKAETHPARVAHQALLKVFEKLPVELIAQTSGVTPEQARVAIEDIKALKKGDENTVKVRQAITPSLFYGQSVDEAVAEIKGDEPVTDDGEMMFSRKEQQPNADLFIGPPSNQTVYRAVEVNQEEYDLMQKMAIRAERDATNARELLRTKPIGKDTKGYQQTLDSSERFIKNWETKIKPWMKNILATPKEPAQTSLFGGEKPISQIEREEDQRTQRAAVKAKQEERKGGEAQLAGLPLFEDQDFEGSQTTLQFSRKNPMDRAGAEAIAEENNLSYDGNRGSDQNRNIVHSFTDNRTGTKFLAVSKDDVQRALGDISEKVAPENTVDNPAGLRFSRKKAAQIDTLGMSYDDFQKLSPEQQKEAFERIQDENTSNPVTNVPGQKAHILELRRATENGRVAVTVAIGDMNGLKEYNDKLIGMGGSDRLMRTVYDRIEEAIPGVKIQHLHGDEYAIIAKGMSKEELRDKLKDAMAELARRHPIEKDGLTYRPTMSWTIGEAKSPSEIGKINPKNVGKNEIGVETKDKKGYNTVKAAEVPSEELVTRDSHENRLRQRNLEERTRRPNTARPADMEGQTTRTGERPRTEEVKFSQRESGEQDVQLEEAQPSAEGAEAVARERTASQQPTIRFERAGDQSPAAAIIKALSDRDGVDYGIEDIAIVVPVTEEQKAILDVVERVSGAKAYFLEMSPRIKTSFNGVNFNRKTFIDINSEYPILETAFHEVNEQLKKDYPGHYSRLVKIAIDNLTKEGRDRVQARADYEEISFEEAAKEFSFDWAGEVMAERSFWDDLQNKAPETFKKLVELLIKTIDKFLNRIPRTSKYNTIFKDTKAMRDSLLDVVRATQGGEDQAAVDGTIQFMMKAFHGSPHKFDKFEMRPMTGEGAMAFGHGLYFTNSEDIAAYYAKTTAANKERMAGDLRDRSRLATFGGKNLVEEYGIENDSELLGLIKSKNRGAVLAHINKQARHWAELAVDKEYPYREYAIEEAAKYKKLKADAQKSEMNYAAGNLYSVSIHKGKEPNEYDYIQWDKSLTEKQISKIYNQAIKEDIRKFTSYDDYKDRPAAFEKAISKSNGSTVYQYLSRYLRGDKAASEFLLRAGIDGIDYPAGSLGTTYQNRGARNYVVFDPEAVTIEERATFSRKGKAVSQQFTPEEIREYSVDPETVPVKGWSGRVMFHGTDKASAKSIVKSGVDPARSTGGYFGDGFYMASDETIADKNYADMNETGEPGDVVAVRISKDANILDLRDPKDWEKWKSIKPDERMQKKGFHKYATDNGIDGVFDRSFGGVVVYNKDALEPIGTKEDIRFSRKGPQPADKNLIALHNIEEQDIAKADKSGGLAVPSIGVTKKDRAFEGFGSVTLVADKDMVDPGKPYNPVFEGDVYSATVPRPVYKKNRKAGDNFLASMNNVAWKDYGMSYGGNAENKIQAGDRDGFVRDIKNDDIAMAMFLKENGITIKKPMRSANYAADWVDLAKTKPVMDWFEKNPDIGTHLWNDNEGAKAKELGDAIRAGVEIIYADQPEVVQEIAGRILDEDGKAYFGPADQLHRTWYNEKENKQEVDTRQLTKDLEEKVKEVGQDKFEKWVEQKADAIFHSPYIDKKGKPDYTLENIVDAMTAGRTAGVEKNLVFGINKAKSFGVRLFKNVDEMRAAEDRLADYPTYEAAKKKTEKKFFDLAGRLEKHYEYSDTFQQMDDVSKSLADYYRGGRTLENAQRALRKNGFRQVPERVAREMMAVAKQLIEDPVVYFEAKPQRAVKMSEFKGAVIPKDASQETRDILKKNGLSMVEYDPAVEGDRAKKVQGFAEKEELVFSRKQKRDIEDVTGVSDPQIQSKYRRAEELKSEARKIRRRLPEAPQGTIDSRADLELKIRDMDDMSREAVKGAVLSYAEYIGLDELPKNRIAAIVNRAQSPLDIRRAIEQMDGILERRQQSELFNRARDAVFETYAHLKKIQGKTRSATDIESNRQMRDYIMSLMPEAWIVRNDEGDFVNAYPTKEEAEELVEKNPGWTLDTDTNIAEKAMAWWLGAGKDVKTNRDQAISELGEDVVNWIDKPGGPVPRNARLVVNRIIGRSLKEKPAKELREIIADLYYMRKFGRLAMKEVDAKRQEREEAEIKESISEIKVKTPQVSTQESAAQATAKTADKEREKESSVFRKFGYGLLSAENIIEKVTGWAKDSKLKKLIFDPLYEAAKAEKIAKKKALKFFDETYGDAKAISAMRYEPYMDITVEKDIGEGNVEAKTFPITLDQAMGIYALSKDPGQRRRLAATLSPNLEHAEAIIDQVVAGLATKYKDMVKKQWDYYYNDQWERVNDVYKKEHQIDMPRVRFYMPMGGLNSDPSSYLTEDLMERAVGKAATSKGFTESRVAIAKPLSNYRFFDMVIGNMQKVEHYVAFNDAVRRANRALINKDFIKALDSHDPEARKQIEDWLKAMARGSARAPENVGSTDKLVQGLANTYSVYQLGGKLTSMLMQFSALPRGAYMVKPKYMAKALGEMLKNPVQTVKMVNEYSPDMESRMKNWDMAVSDLMEQQETKSKIGAKGVQQTFDKFREFTMYGIGALDKLTATAVWLGKYTEVINSGDKSLAEQQLHDKAVYEADKVIRKTQQGGGLLNSSKLERGSPIERAITQFQSEPRKALQMFYEYVNTFPNLTNAERAKYLALAVFIPAAMVQLIRQGFKPDEPEEVLNEAVQTLSSGLPLVGVIPGLAYQAAQDVTQEKLTGAMKRRPRYQTEANPSLAFMNVIKESADAVNDLKQGDWTAAMRKGLNFVPGGRQIDRSIDGTKIILDEKRAAKALKLEDKDVKDTWKRVKYYFYSDKAVNKEFDKILVVRTSKNPFEIQRAMADYKRLAGESKEKATPEQLKWRNRLMVYLGRQKLEQVDKKKELYEELKERLEKFKKSNPK